MALELLAHQLEKFRGQVLPAPVEFLDSREIEAVHRREQRVRDFFPAEHLHRDPLLTERAAFVTHRSAPLVLEPREIIVEAAKARITPVILVAEAFEESGALQRRRFVNLA